MALFNSKKATTVSALSAEFTHRFEAIVATQQGVANSAQEQADALMTQANEALDKATEATNEVSRANRMVAKIKNFFEDDESIDLPDHVEPINETKESSVS